MLAHPDETGRRARRVLSAVAFDPGSFGLASRERDPQVVFAVPVTTRRGSVAAIALTPRAVPTPAWWHDLGEDLPLGADSVRHWTHGEVDVTARLLDEGDRARVVLRDGNHNEWVAGTVTAPVQHVYWLDRVNAETRKALRRAFNDASMYSDDTRIARGPARGKKTLELAAVSRAARSGVTRSATRHAHAARRTRGAF